MKIQYALVSCNTNPRYTAYWPTVAAAWLKLGIIPVCLFIPDKPDLKLPPAPEGSIVHTIPPLSDVHIMSQALILRFWASYLYPDAIVATSDMDCVPLSKHFFHTQLTPYPDHAYLHLQPFLGGYPWTHLADIPEKITHINKVRYLQAWFHVAKGRVMHEVLELPPVWETACKKIAHYYLQKEAKITMGLYSYESHREAVPWFGDEIYPSLRLHHSGYSPIYCLTYQRDQYAGLLWNMIPFINQRIDNRYIGIHLPPPNTAEDVTIAEHLLRHGTVPSPPRYAWWYIRCWSWLISSNKISRFNIIGPWLSLVLVLLIWCALRLLPPRKPYDKILLVLLLHKRTDLLGKHPQTRTLFNALLSIKNMLRRK